MACSSVKANSRLIRAVKAKALCLQPSSTIQSAPYSRRGLDMVKQVTGGQVKRVPFQVLNGQAAISMPIDGSPHAIKQVLAAERRHALEIAPKPGSILDASTHSFEFECQQGTCHGDLVKVGAFDDKSSKHPYEDFSMVFDTPGGTVMVVCDGVSGAGSVDTPYFVRALCEGLRARLSEMSIDNQSDFKSVVTSALHHVIDDICPPNECQTASTTCSILFKSKSNRLFSAMIGDSGFKIVREDQVIVDESSGGCESPLTDDNLMCGIPSEINMTHLVPIPSQLVSLHSCYGENKETLDNIRFSEFPLKDGDRVILASDGVWDNMDGTGCIETSARQASYMLSYNDFWMKTFERIESDPGTGDLNATKYFDSKARILEMLDGYLALQAPIKHDDSTYVTLTVGGASYKPGNPVDIFPGGDEWETAVVNRLEALYPSQCGQPAALSMDDFQQAQTQIVNPDLLFCHESM